MRVAVGTLVLVLVSVFASAGLAVPREVISDRSNSGSGHRAAGSLEMLALSSELSDGSQQLVLIDPRDKSLVVYHIARGTGQISLKSSRNIQYDLQMDDFNGGNPSPQEIRSLLGHP